MMYPRIAFILITIILISSCQFDSDSSRQTASENNVSIAIPTAQISQKLIQDGSLRALLSIPGARDLKCDTQINADTCELSVDTVAEKASARIDITVGTYRPQVSWEYRDPIFINPSRSDGFWDIANAQKPVTIETGKTSLLSFAKEDYDPLPDADTDGVSNLVELENRSNPGDPNDPPRDVMVPDCRDVAEADCKTLIVNAGLIVGARTEEASASIPAGNVIRTVPAENTMVAKGGTVNLVVSIGPAIVPVPDCRNVMEADCKALIINAGLIVGARAEEVSATIPASNVIRTIPAENTMVAKGSIVDLVVAISAPVVPAIHSSGSLEIQQTFRADLDEGQVSVSGGTNPGMDIWFEADTAVERFVTPTSSAVTLARVGTSSVGFGGCSTTPLSNTRIPIAELPEGSFVCVRTDLGRFSEFVVTTTVGPSPGILRIDYTTWEIP
jgi:hypothetical protein